MCGGGGGGDGGRVQATFNMLQDLIKKTDSKLFSSSYLEIFQAVFFFIITFGCLFSNTFLI